MGIIKALVVSAAGFWSAKAVSRLNVRVQRIPVPALSSLLRWADESGDFFADAYVIELPKRIQYSNIQLEVSDLARAFFSSKAFCAVERPLLKLFVSNKKPFLYDFNLGQQIWVWTVVERTSDEILLEWQHNNTRGLTWFHVSPDQKLIMFGSSLGSMKRPARFLQV